jgi:hypothetical protein
MPPDWLIRHLKTTALRCVTKRAHTVEGIAAKSRIVPTLLADIEEHGLEDKHTEFLKVYSFEAGQFARDVRWSGLRAGVETLEGRAQ